MREHNELGDIERIRIMNDEYLLVEATTSLWIFRIDILNPDITNKLVMVNNFHLNFPEVLHFEI